jgi:hypothetical protein
MLHHKTLNFSFEKQNSHFFYPRGEKELEMGLVRSIIFIFCFGCVRSILPIVRNVELIIET